MPHLASPPGIHLPLALDWLYPLITDTIWWATLSSSPKTPVSGGRLTSIWGSLDICPLLDQFHLASITYSELSSLTSLRAWGMQKNLAVTLPTYWFPPKRRQCQTGCMAFPPYGWTCIRPGCTLWRKQLGNWLPWSPVDLIGLMPWCGSMGTPTMHHSAGRGT